MAVGTRGRLGSRAQCRQGMKKNEEELNGVASRQRRKSEKNRSHPAVRLLQVAAGNRPACAVYGKQNG